MEIYVGEAVFIDGARPDVQTAYPTMPRNSRAGWGFMVLTNMLPSQGNGTYQFFMQAFDIEGLVLVLGTRTDHLRQRARDQALRGDRYADTGRRRFR